MKREEFNEHIKTTGEVMRFVTPMLVSIALFMLVNINTLVSSIDAKVFHHLTNADVHIPRSEYTDILRQVEKNREMFSTQINQLHKDLLAEIRLLHSKSSQ